MTAALLLLWGNSIVSRADAKGVVIPNSVNIRKMPELGSEVIGSSKAGKEIDIRGQVESGGIHWYQVYISADTMGYVRADMIEKKGDGTIPTVTVSAGNDESQSAMQPADGDGENGQGTLDQPTPSGGGAEVAAQEAMDLQYAATNVQAKVRPDPSTSNPQIDSLTPGTQVVVSGKSQGSDSKTWYYVTFTGSNGSERTGYIRSDLLDLGEMLPVEAPPEEAPPEVPEEPSEPVRNDYELKIETDSEGVATWYLYNNIKGEKEELLPLLESMSSQSVDDEKGMKAIVKQRIVIVVLSVLLAILAVVVIILAFKLRDTYYEDDEDEEEERRSARREDAERDERRTARRENAGKAQGAGRRTAADEERAARRRTAAGEGESRRREGKGGSGDRQEGRRREREVSYQEDAAAVSPAPRHKAKNFLLDDDEFEFEFLNMDDKDLK